MAKSTLHTHRSFRDVGARRCGQSANKRQLAVHIAHLVRRAERREEHRRTGAQDLRGHQRTRSTHACLATLYRTIANIGGGAQGACTQRDPLLTGAPLRTLVNARVHTTSRTTHTVLSQACAHA